MAFGPCLVTTADAYRSVGGMPPSRGELIEDIHLARAFGARPARALPRRRQRHLASACTPDGLRQLVEGWTKNLAGGPGLAPLVPTLGAVAWVAAAAAVAVQAVSAPGARAQWPGGRYRLAGGDAPAALDAAPDRDLPLVDRGRVPGPAARLHRPVRRSWCGSGRSRSGPLAWPRDPRGGEADVPILELGGPAAVAANVAVLGRRPQHQRATSATGCRPSALAEDGRLLRLRGFERGGRVYDRDLRIRTVEGPPARGGRPLRRGRQQAAAARPGTRARSERFVVETRRAELGHWLAPRSAARCAYCGTRRWRVADGGLRVGGELPRSSPSSATTAVRCQRVVGSPSRAVERPRRSGVEGTSRRTSGQQHAVGLAARCGDRRCASRSQSR